METLSADPTAPASIRRLPIFGLISLALMMMSIDATIVATALHALQDGLGAPIHWISWTITAYSFGFVIMLPISGNLSQRYGQRRIFVASVAAFTVASLLCGIVSDVRLLIFFRILQAAGGAGLTPAATAIVVNTFGDERDRAVSLFGTIFPVGAMIGPVFGGFFIKYWSWRGIFLVNVPIGILILAFAFALIPADPPTQDDREPMDFKGMGLLAFNLFFGMLAASLIAETRSSLRLPALVISASLAVVSLILFLRHLRSTSNPFIRPHLIYGRGFGPINLVNASFSGIPFGVLSLLPLYAISRYGIDELQAGTILIAQGAATGILSFTFAMLLRRTGYRLPLAAGALISATGIFLLGLSPPDSFSPGWWLGVSSFIMGFGVGIQNPASRNAGLHLEPDSSATIAALRSMSMQIGSIIAIGLASAVISGASDPTHAHSLIYMTTAFVVVLNIPLVWKIPEHRGAW